MQNRRGPQRDALQSAQLVTGNRALQAALVQGRQNGHLKLRGRGLAALPPETCDIGSVVLPDGSAWWETRETLETLDASQNEIAELPDEIESLDQLRELDASRNQLRTLPAAPVWSALESLVSLGISHNRLEALPDGLGQHNRPPLVRLHASNNQLVSVPSSLGGLVELVELDLSHNALSQLPRGLAGMACLKKLNVSRNRLASMPDDLLMYPPPLVDVDASENALSVLAFPVPTVQTLNLAKNRLTGLALEGCASLQELSAPYNQLVSTPRGLPTLPSLATLDLGSNKLVRLDELAHCASLTRIDVSNNDVREVPPLLGNLKLNRLALLGNPLRTMPSAILNGPTPKLLAHLRGKIVDAAPQWEGDTRGQIVPPPQQELDRSMTAIGAEPEMAREQQRREFQQHRQQQLLLPQQQYEQPPQQYEQPQQYGHAGRGGGYGGGAADVSDPYWRARGALGAENQPAQQPPQQQQYGGGGGHGAYGGGCAMGGGGAFDPRPAEEERGTPRSAGFDALYNRPPPSNPPSARTSSAAASAPFQTMLNSAVPPPPGSAGGAGGLGDLATCVLKEGTELLAKGLKLQALPAGGYPESLTRIDASSNQLRAPPADLALLVPQLAALELSHNLLSSLPAELADCPDLTSVRVARNQLSELTFLSCALPHLVELVADYNGLSAIPPALWRCPRLKHVSLCANKLTAASLHMPPPDAAAHGGAIAPLEHLDVGENRLGTLPPLVLFPALREVHVQQTGLRELPASQLSPLRQLRTLDVSMNDVGTLPPELALLPQLQTLTIVGNPIRSIPQSVQSRGATAVLDLLRKRLG